MQTQSLNNGYWQLRQAGAADWLPARVPGDVHTALMAAGKLPDPFYGTNETKVQWVSEKSWEYRLFFYPLPAVFRQEQIWLVCGGLDTLAEVRLNGQILGQADNTFLTWQWEVKNLLREGENRLEILFRSPVSYARSRDRRKHMNDMGNALRGAPYLRKPPSHFGWDWGPKLASMGPWQGVRLEGRSKGQLGEISFEQKHAPGVVTLTAKVQCALWEQGEPHHTVRLRISGPDRQVWQLDAPARPQSSLTVTMTDPRLWWPHGYGEQNLYTAEVELRGGEDEVLDTRSYTLGLRTLELRQEKDAYGVSFNFVVNGTPILCRGSNWIPADSFPTRVTAERVEALLRAAVETHQNMIRVWGGGYYESDTFYDLCDRLGILVWQDFQFACATYPLDDTAYLDNVRCEVIENVRRLRHHPSLVLWCGNNEIEWLGVKMGWWRITTQAQAYQRFFFEDLPAILATEDPQRPYWPGSPSSNKPFEQPNSFESGDAHLWEVYAMYHPPKFYRQQTPRFVSEFGFQSLPHQRTVAQFAPPKAHHLKSAEMLNHQRAIGGNAKLHWYLAQRFRMPKNFDGLVYLSQVLQAEVVRIGIEHWRRHPERTSGTLYWQINDCWPVISWASIDYYGRWKALQYAARQFFAPVLLSIEDETEKNARRMAVWVSNDQREPWQGQIRWTLETLTGEVIEGGDQPVVCAPQSAECALKFNFTHQNGKVDWRQMVFVAELWQGSTRQALKVAHFLPEKEVRCMDSGLQAEIQPINTEEQPGGVSEPAGSAPESPRRVQICVQARRLARFVELSLEGADVVFSDNFFDLPAGRTVTVTFDLPAGWRLEQAQAALRVRSLNEIACDSPIATALKGGLALLNSLIGSAWEGAVMPLFR